MDLFDDQPNSVPPFEVPRREGYSVRALDYPDHFILTVPNGEFFYSKHFFSKKVSDRCLEYFQENQVCDWRSPNWNEFLKGDISEIPFKNILWSQDSIKLYGKTIPLPRLTSWYGDSGREYTYSGIKSVPNSWNEGLMYLKSEIERCSGEEFNSVLLNWYRDGEDYLNWHSDDEKELGINPVIASANFGETRDFLVRRKDDKSAKICFPLMHGTLLLMRGETQHYWEHSVPKRKKVARSRFNLTFRRIHE